MQTLWLYIWRFQPFHNGHKSIVDTMLEDNEKNLILMWVSGTKSLEENPYTYEKRLEFLSETYKDVHNLDIAPLIDMESNKRWVQQMLAICYLQKADHVKLYCWNKKQDSAVQVITQYENLFEWKKLEIIEIDRNKLPISGTQIRHEIRQQWKESIKKLVPESVYKNLI